MIFKMLLENNKLFIFILLITGKRTVFAQSIISAVLESTSVIKTALTFAPMILGAMFLQLAIIWVGKKLQSIINKKKYSRRNRNYYRRKESNPLYWKVDSDRAINRLNNRSQINRRRKINKHY